MPSSRPSFFSYNLVYTNIRPHAFFRSARMAPCLLFLLREKMVTQRFDDASVALPKPLSYPPVPELGLFIGCKPLALLTLDVEGSLGDLGPICA